MENREKVLKKIENLLALAGNNPSENEALAAALKAQELMAKYNIELAEVQGTPEKEEIFKAEYTPNGSSHYVSKWRHQLSCIIARNFCCETYLTNKTTTVFYGYTKDAKIAVEVFKFLFETGNKLANRYYLKCKKGGRDTKGVLNTYLLGFCAGIDEALGKQCTALMIVTPKEVKESFAEMSKSWKTISGKIKASMDARAYERGKIEGKETASARSLESK